MYNLRIFLLGFAFILIPAALQGQEDPPELSSFLTWEINKARGESPEAPITAEYLSTIESFTVSRPHPNGDIPFYTDLRGIEYLVNLRELELVERYLPDLSVIASLHNLESLTLRYCGISDISPLDSLQNLEHLDLSKNAISDYSPLATLQNLDAASWGLAKSKDGRCGGGGRQRSGCVGRLRASLASAADESGFNGVAGGAVCLRMY